LVAGAEWKLGVVQSYKESDDFDFLEYLIELEEGESISQNDMLLISKNEVLRVEDCVFLDFAHPATMYMYWILLSYMFYFCTVLPGII
jgi:hypothetical protein